MITTELPARLVIDLPNWLGDQIMALPAVDRLVRGNTEGTTVLHTRPAMARFLAEIFPTVAVASTARKTQPFAAAHRICNGNGRFAIGVTMRNAYRAKIMLFLAARRSLGSGGQGARFLLSEHIDVDRMRHQVHDFDPILVRLGLEGVDPGWRPHVGGALQSQTEAIWSAAGLSRGTVVGLAPATASGSVKRWPSERFAALADELGKHGLAAAVVVGPGEEELGKKISRAASRDLPVVGAGLDVAGVAGLMARLSAVVSIDSGAMHLAAAVGANVVALFGPTSPQRTAPQGRGIEIIHFGVDCAPCEHRHCPYAHHRCMTEIGVAEVARAVVGLIERSAL